MTDHAAEAISRMRSPSEMHIICVDITNRCDLQCSNCTRLLANQKHRWDMTPENFRSALRSLEGFTGVIAMIGGNPCLHPKFAELCQIFAEEVPEKSRRGLWSNNVFDHQQVIADTFGFFNLNPHDDGKGLASMERLKELLPSIQYYKGSSHHAPILAAVRDLYPEQEMWEKISRCDINREWSATIVQNNGLLSAYFCEVAASFDLARGDDHGVQPFPGWWNQHISNFSGQVRHFCPGCGVPARLEGQKDSDDTDTATESNVAITKVRKRRKTKMITEADTPASAGHVTDYTDQHVRPPIVSVVIPFFNAGDTILETIRSVLAQHLTEWEILIIDDCSTEPFSNGVSIELDWVMNEPRISYHRSDRNLGPAVSRNIGLAKARGKYVCFLDSDDQYDPAFFREAARALDFFPDISAITTGVELTNCHRPVSQYHHGCVVNCIPSNVMVRTEIARLIGGFPEDLAFRGEAAGEDIAFKGALSNFTMHHLSHPYTKYRVKEGSHFDRFLNSTTLRHGALSGMATTKEEQDGSLAAALERYYAEVDRRIAQARGVPANSDPIQFYVDYPEEGYSRLNFSREISSIVFPTQTARELGSALMDGGSAGAGDVH